MLRAARGRVIVTGIGKSGHVGQKIAATFASTGTPAFFVHPTEASHGDLGMITPRRRASLALSWSGETVELKPLITYSRRFNVPLIAITSRADSALASSPTSCWSCRAPRRPARTAWRRPPRPPCSSPSATASPSRCSRPRASPPHDFKVFHPGGSLGASLKYVADVMHKGDRLPLVRDTVPMSAALVTMTQKSLGCLGIVDAKGKLVGIITDGDLRRHMGDEPASAAAPSTS